MTPYKRKFRDLISPRMGFHYFADTDHYTAKDLSIWLPILKQINASWLVLLANASRAIPEQFISSLVDGGINPVLHMLLPLPNSPAAGEMKALLKAYSRWGVQHIILFDRPNMMHNWSTAGWIQQDLVERFVDRFLPLASSVAQSGMMPIFPPLEPGGNYWDLSFLKQALQSIERRGYTDLVRQMGLASYAFTYNHELDYGSGGPIKWPKSIPYVNSPDSEDQRGFRNYEWLQSTAVAACGQELPVFMLGAGIKEPGVSYSPEIHAGICLNILDQLKGTSAEMTIPDYVQCCNFYLLSAAPGSNQYEQAWFKTEDDYLPIVDLLLPEFDQTLVAGKGNVSVEDNSNINFNHSHPIEHYLLLPLYDWGVAEYHLEVTRPFIQKYHPTIGFSIQEAALAKKVTVIGGELTFSDEALSELRSSGSIVDRVTGDGISIATQLAER